MLDGVFVVVVWLLFWFWGGFFGVWYAFCLWFFCVLFLVYFDFFLSVFDKERDEYEIRWIGRYGGSGKN